MASHFAKDEGLSFPVENRTFRLNFKTMKAVVESREKDEKRGLNQMVLALEVLEVKGMKWDQWPTSTDNRRWDDAKWNFQLKEPSECPIVLPH